MTKLSDLPAAAAADGTERGIVNQGAGDGTTSLLSAAQTVVNRATGTGSSLALGSYATATQNNGTAIGGGSDATGAEGASAFGYSCTASGAYSFAAGYSATASGEYSCAVGGGCTASATGAIAIGNNANASQQNAVALGAGVAAALANSVNIGTKGFILVETTGLGNPPANSGMLFVEDTGSAKSRLVIKWPDGTTEVLATQA